MNVKKLALIIGGTRGIGRSISQYFASKGYDLLIVSKSASSLANVKRDILFGNSNLNVYTYQMDMNNPSEFGLALSELLEGIGVIDVLVNSAGVMVNGMIDVQREDVDSMMNVNLFSTILACNIVARKMKAQGFGEIYNIGSLAGLENINKIGVYASTKAALISLSESFYKELLPYGVSVSCLCPSVVDTEMTDDGRIPNELKIAPVDIAKSIEFIQGLSSGASVPLLAIRCKVIDLENV